MSAPTARAGSAQKSPAPAAKAAPLSSEAAARLAELKAKMKQAVSQERAHEETLLRQADKNTFLAKRLAASTTSVKSASSSPAPQSKNVPVQFIKTPIKAAPGNKNAPSTPSVPPPTSPAPKSSTTSSTPQASTPGRSTRAAANSAKAALAVTKAVEEHSESESESDSASDSGESDTSDSVETNRSTRASAQKATSSSSQTPITSRRQATGTSSSSSSRTESTAAAASLPSPPPVRTPSKRGASSAATPSKSASLASSDSATTSSSSSSVASPAKRTALTPAPHTPRTPGKRKPTTEEEESTLASTKNTKRLAAGDSKSPLAVKLAAVDDDDIKLSSVARRLQSDSRDYFSLHAPGTAKRGNFANRDDSHRFAALSDKQRIAILRGLPVKHAAEKEALNDSIRAQFPAWYRSLKSGFNVLLDGFGSKKEILTEFGREWLLDAPVVVVNGYFPAASLRSVLLSITEGIMQHTGVVYRSLHEHVDCIRKFLTSPHSFVREIYIIMHNIDGAPFRSTAVQASLAALAAIEGVHLIASIDHILAPILWDLSALSQFRWHSYDATNFQPYMKELVYEKQQFVSEGHTRARGIRLVLSSLTPNHWGILKVLATHQINDATKSGLKRREFISLCADKLLVASDKVFSQVLQELQDHGLIELRAKAAKRGKAAAAEGADKDAAQRYSIPYPDSVIRAHILQDGSVADDTGFEPDFASIDDEEQVAPKRKAGRPKSSNTSAKKASASASKGGSDGAAKRGRKKGTSLDADDAEAVPVGAAHQDYADDDFQEFDHEQELLQLAAEAEDESAFMSRGGDDGYSLDDMGDDVDQAQYESDLHNALAAAF